MIKTIKYLVVAIVAVAAVGLLTTMVEGGVPC